MDQVDSHYSLSEALWDHAEIFWQAWLLNSLFTFSLRLLQNVLKINFTKKFEFEAADPSEDYAITKAMTAKIGPSGEQELMKYLAFFDFHELAAYSKSRRSQFYVISQPGKNI